MPLPPLTPGWTALLVPTGILAASSAHDALRISAIRISRAVRTLSRRDAQMRHFAALEHHERTIGSAHERHADLIRSHIAPLPDVSRRLGESAARIERAQAQATEVPPLALPAPDDVERAATALERLDQGPRDEWLMTQRERELAELGHAREMSGRRLAAIAPMRTDLAVTRRELPRLNRNIEAILAHGPRMDDHMARYEQLHERCDETARLLARSSLTHVLTSALALGVAALGAVGTFWLTDATLAQALDSHAPVTGAWSVADLASAVTVSVEIAMGLFFVEGMGLTHLYPPVSRLKPAGRRALAAASLLILLALDLGEVCLADYRGAYMQYIAHSAAALTGADGADASAILLAHAQALLDAHTWAAHLFVLILSGTLPLALAFCGIPLETFAHAGRALAGRCVIAALQGLALALRLAAAILSPARAITRGIAQGWRSLCARLERPTSPSPGHAALAMPTLWRRRALDERRV